MKGAVAFNSYHASKIVFPHRKVKRSKIFTKKRSIYAFEIFLCKEKLKINLKRQASKMQFDCPFINDFFRRHFLDITRRINYRWFTILPFQIQISDMEFEKCWNKPSI